MASARTRRSELWTRHGPLRVWASSAALTATARAAFSGVGWLTLGGVVVEASPQSPDAASQLSALPSPAPHQCRVSTRHEGFRCNDQARTLEKTTRRMRHDVGSGAAGLTWFSHRQPIRELCLTAWSLMMTRSLARLREGGPARMAAASAERSRWTMVFAYRAAVVVFPQAFGSIIRTAEISANSCESSGRCCAGCIGPRLHHAIFPQPLMAIIRTPEYHFYASDGPR